MENKTEFELELNRVREIAGANTKKYNDLCEFICQELRIKEVPGAYYVNAAQIIGIKNAIKAQLQILQNEIEKLENKISRLNAENYDLKTKLVAYVQNENRRYQYEQDYLPYSEDERD